MIMRRVMICLGEKMAKGGCILLFLATGLATYCSPF